MSYQFESTLVIYLKEWKLEEITFDFTKEHDDDKPYLRLVPLCYHERVFKLRISDMIEGHDGISLHNNSDSLGGGIRCGFHIDLSTSMFDDKIKRFDDRVVDLLVKSPQGWIKWKSREQIKTHYMTMRQTSEESKYAHINIRIPFTSKVPSQCQCFVEWNHHSLNKDHMIAEFEKCRPFPFQCMVDMIGTLWIDPSGSIGVVWYATHLQLFTKDIEGLCPPITPHLALNSDEELIEKPDNADDEDDVAVPHHSVTDDEDDDEPETTADLFGLTCDTHGLLFSAPNKYLYGEKTTASKYDVMSRFFREMNGLFDGFDWQHACIAGGLLTGLFEVKVDPKIYQNSDIDLFIYGDSLAETKKYFARTFAFISSKYKEKFHVLLSKSHDYMILDFVIQGVTSRTLQMIGVSGIKTPRQLIGLFDLSHCQIAFDGNDLIGTSSFRNSMQTHQTQIMRESTSELRLYKTYQRGFSVLMPNHPVHVKNSKDLLENEDPYSLLQVVGLPDNLHEYTLDKLLSQNVISSFTHKPSREEVSGDVLTKWFTKYVETLLPCSFH